MRRTTLAGVLAGAVVLTGCTGPASSPSTGSPTAQSSATAATPSPAATATATTAPTTDQQGALGQAVIAYTNAYFEADWDTAYTRLWSERCKADNEARNSFIGTIAAQKVNYPDENKPRAGAVTEERIEGDIGIVTYDYSFSGQTQVIENQPWILEGGTWHFDDC